MPVYTISNQNLELFFEAWGNELILNLVKFKESGGELISRQPVNPQWWIAPETQFILKTPRARRFPKGGGQIEFRWASPEGITYTQRWVLPSEGTALKVQASLSNEASQEVTLRGVESLRLGFEWKGEARFFRLHGLSRQLPGSPDSREEYGTFTLLSSSLSSREHLSSGYRSSLEFVPWFLLYDPQKHLGVVGGLAWSGKWDISLERRDLRVEIRGGPSGFVVKIPPKGIYRAPDSYLGFFTGLPEEGRNVLTYYLQQYEMPPQPEDFPWTQYNTWYAYNISFQEDQLLKEVEASREIGLEVFYVDAGWYRGSPPRGDFSQGLGDWRENPLKFPRGLKRFSQEVHQKGLRFGLWVEPERVDLATQEEGSPLSQWLAHRKGKPISSWRSSAVQVCLGCPSAQEWVKRWLSALIRQYSLEWVKWDSNMWGVCTRSDHGHSSEEGEKAQIEGLYKVIDALRRRFPSLILENCAGGGHRMDYGLLRRTQIGWVSDDTWPSRRVRHHLAGSAWAFPLSYLNSWVVPSEEEPITEGMEEEELRYIFRSRMLGAFGISARISDWSEKVRKIAQEEVALYKRIRPLIKDNRLYFPLLLSEGLPKENFQNSLWGRTLASVGPWEAYQMLSRAGDQGVLLVFREGGSESRQTFLLRALAPYVYYRLRDQDRGDVWVFSGWDLMKRGFTVELRNPRSSAVFWIEKESSGGFMEKS